MAILVITVPDAEVPRIRKAFGEYLRLGRDATAEEIRQWLIKTAKEAIKEQEHRTQVNSIIITAPEIT